MESMYSFGEDSALTSFSKPYCLLSDRGSVVFIDYMLCSVEIMCGLLGLKPLLLSEAVNVTSVYILIFRRYLSYSVLIYLICINDIFYSSAYFLISMFINNLY